MDHLVKVVFILNAMMEVKSWGFYLNYTWLAPMLVISACLLNRFGVDGIRESVLGRK